MRPPLHPWLYTLSQSTNSCSDRDVRLPVTIWFIPSTAPTVENAQQLPLIYIYIYKKKKKNLTLKNS